MKPVGRGFIRLTALVKNLLYVTVGSFMIDMKDRHSTAQNCWSQLALYGDLVPDTEEMRPSAADGADADSILSSIPTQISLAEKRKKIQERRTRMKNNR